MSYEQCQSMRLSMWRHLRILKIRLCCAGLGMQAFNGSRALQEFFKVVSLSIDKQNVTYISTLEGSKVSRPGLLTQPCVACIASSDRSCTSKAHLLVHVLMAILV